MIGSDEEEVLVRRLLELGADPNIMGVLSTPLGETVDRRNIDMVALLLSHGALTFLIW